MMRAMRDNFRGRYLFGFGVHDGSLGASDGGLTVPCLYSMIKGEKKEAMNDRLNLCAILVFIVWGIVKI